LLNCIHPIGPSFLAIIRSGTCLQAILHSNKAQVRSSGLDNLAVTQIGDAFEDVGVFPEYLLGVLAFFGRGSHHSVWRAAKLDRLVDHGDVAKCGMLDGSGHAEMLHLRVCEYLVRAVDRTTGNTWAVEQIDEFAACFQLRDLRDRLIESHAVGGTG